MRVRRGGESCSLISPLFFIAATASAALSKGVVLIARTAPPAAARERECRRLDIAGHLDDHYQIVIAESEPALRDLPAELLDHGPYGVQPGVWIRNQTGLPRV